MPLKILLIAFVIFLTGCSESTAIPSSTAPNDNTVVPSATAPNSKKIVALPELAEASCFFYAVYDETGAQIALPDTVKTSALECPAVLPSLNPAGDFLLYYDLDTDTFRQYIFETQQNNALFSVENPDTFDGAAPWIWDAAGQLTATVLIDWETHPLVTKFLVLDFTNPQKITSELVSAKINLVCGGNCGSVPNEDYWWVDADTLGYQTYVEVPYDYEAPFSHRQITWR
jgi:hypothetical protein